MKERFTPQIDIQTVISILKQEHLLSSHFPHNEKIRNEQNKNCSIFFHSHDVEDFLNKNNAGHFIYVARTGKSFDGHTLAQRVLDANQFFIGDEKKHISHEHFIPVTNPENALNCILKESYRISRDDFVSVGITGTNGKTSTTQITGQILEHLFLQKILKIGTLGIQIGDEIQSGSHVTTPNFPAFLSSLYKIKSMGINKLVMEVTSHGLKENRLFDWKFDVGVFTNFTQDHLDYHKTMEDYRSSKQELFRNKLKDNATAIINMSTPEGVFFIESAANKKTNLFLVSKNPSFKEDISIYRGKFQSISLLNLEDTKFDLFGLSGTFVLQRPDFSQLQRASFSCPLVGDFQFENLICSVGVALALGFSLHEIIPTLAQIKNIPGRLELITEGSNPSAPKVVVDYAHTPDALEKAILACKSALSKTGKLTTVFGCGGDRDPSKRAPMGEIASALSHRVVVTSDNPRTENPEQIIDDIFLGIKKKHEIFRESDRAKAIQYAILTSTENDLVLVAGKGHENYQVIGHTKYPFSDAAIIKDILSQKHPTGRA